MAKVPPSIPLTIGVVMHVESSKPTVADLERAKEREESNLHARHRELQHARDQVSSLERQVVNVQRSIEDLSARIEERSAVEKVEYLSSRVAELEQEVRELRNPRDGREFS